MSRIDRTRHLDAGPGWGQAFPGWSPLVDPDPLALRAAGSVARWWWPTLTVAGFVAVAGYVAGHDHPTPGLSQRGLVTIALAAVVVVLLTVRRAAGPGPLVRAMVEYAVVAVLGSLLTLAGGLDQPPATPTAPTTEAKQATMATPDTTAPKPKAKVKDDRPGVIRVASKAVRAVTGAAGWLADLWRQADAEADAHPPPARDNQAKPPTSLPTALASTRRPT